MESSNLKSGWLNVNVAFPTIWKFSSRRLTKSGGYVRAFGEEPTPLPRWKRRSKEINGSVYFLVHWTPLLWWGSFSTPAPLPLSPKRLKG
ncbi:hypothetical protein NPIL_515731 [Nephila pilipes]|uniref:Uncharacterized protein n=1 Tax=Nephila pilipes TaxID=299642 RepID=A0A8X6TDW5_NEPPI|nr:hypothetical protein NPIL_515731 [Nephila pilipes]